jgi:hypothetical protein
MMHANFKAQRKGLPEWGFLRFYAPAELYASCPTRDAVLARLEAAE